MKLACKKFLFLTLVIAFMGPNTFGVSFVARHAAKVTGVATGLCAAKFLFTTIENLRPGHKLPLRSKSYWLTGIAALGGMYATRKLQQRAERLQQQEAALAKFAEETKEENKRIQLQIDVGGFPLHTAAAFGDTALVIKLLAHPNIQAQINRLNLTGSTALHCAIVCQHTDILKLLLSTPGIHIEVNYKNNAGRSPLEEAYLLNRSQAVLLLLADPRIDKTESEQFIQQKLLDPDHPLEPNDFAIIEQIPARYLDVQNAEGNTLLHRIIERYGDQNDIKMLRALRAVITKDKNINRPNNDGITPLHLATVRHDSENVMIELLANPNINVNAQTRDGITALHFACIGRFPQTVNLLLRHGADPFMESNSGESMASIVKDFQEKGDQATEEEEAIIAAFEPFKKKLADIITEDTPMLPGTLTGLVTGYLGYDAPNRNDNPTFDAPGAPPADQE